MREYELIILNMFEFACKFLNKQSSKYVRILNVSDAVHRVGTLYKLLSSYRDIDEFRKLLNI